MTWAEWKREREYRMLERIAIQRADEPADPPPLSQQHVWGPRDSYGWRSLPGQQHLTIAPPPRKEES